MRRSRQPSHEERGKDVKGMVQKDFLSDPALGFSYSCILSGLCICPVSLFFGSLVEYVKKRVSKVRWVVSVGFQEPCSVIVEITTIMPVIFHSQICNVHCSWLKGKPTTVSSACRGNHLLSLSSRSPYPRSSPLAPSGKSQVKYPLLIG